ncbi:P-II family nitrogen regulator [[Clostridium] spiroforme]|nr:P-II family nitrogen regulator [Thomasclavelia spiroformis]MBM6881011.1 P-II family nitrogen regulator [Thomasclavelia spiroformis]MBM6931474.1 P-II family nitrogen regulator [Thomasclavelia spiroformis]
MKKLEIIIRPEKLDVLKKILTEDGISGMMISNIMGFGNQKGYTHQYRGTTYAVNLVSKLKVETVIRDEQVEDLMQKIRNELSTGHVGDGKIFVYPVEDALRIRTGDRGESAL